MSINTERLALPTISSLSWMVWFWAGGAVIAAMVITLVAFLGEMDSSFWAGVNSVLVWVVFAAGVTMAPSHGPIYVANGATRTQLGGAAAVALVALALLAAAASGLGFVAEAAVYDRLGWEHDLDPAAGAQATRTVMLAGLFGAFFVSGWLVGIAYLRLARPLFVASILPAAIPVAVASQLGGVEVIGDLAFVSQWVALPVVLAVTAGAAALAARLIRRIPIEP